MKISINRLLLLAMISSLAILQINAAEESIQSHEEAVQEIVNESVAAAYESEAANHDNFTTKSSVLTTFNTAYELLEQVRSNTELKEENYYDPSSKYNQAMEFFYEEIDCIEQSADGTMYENNYAKDTLNEIFSKLPKEIAKEAKEAREKINSRAPQEAQEEKYLYQRSIWGTSIDSIEHHKNRIQKQGGIHQKQIEALNFSTKIISSDIAEETNAMINDESLSPCPIKLDNLSQEDLSKLLTNRKDIRNILQAHYEQLNGNYLQAIRLFRDLLLIRLKIPLLSSNSLCIDIQVQENEHLFSKLKKQFRSKRIPAEVTIIRNIVKQLDKMRNQFFTPKIEYIKSQIDDIVNKKRAITKRVRNKKKKQRHRKNTAIKKKAAAIKIQSIIRGYASRKTTSNLALTIEDRIAETSSCKPISHATNSETSDDDLPELEFKTSELEYETSERNSNSFVEKILERLVATKIQSIVRGYFARKSAQSLKAIVAQINADAQAKIAEILAQAKAEIALVKKMYLTNKTN